ncbi:MAG: SpoIIE family protein phosphatase, partial [Candidatus Omnitrophica bacterium]|nr:SpoIIE family protein phosphatase [Candidatus Omnitrophota bacterium]
MDSSLPQSSSSEDPLEETSELIQKISEINGALIDPENLSRDDLLEYLNRATSLMIRQNQNIQELRHHFTDTLTKLNLEMSQVRDVQESLLPNYPPQIEGLDFASEYLPSGHASGDYYDFLRPTDQLVGSFLADVSGHGAPSAVVMAITRVLVHEHLQKVQSAGEALSLINQL